MSNVVTEVTSTSWAGRMKGACGGICVGIILFFGSFPLLVWNEGRSVERYQSLEEGKKIVVPISDINVINSDNEGKLVYLSGTAQAGSNVTDSLFGVSPPNALKLQRDAQMYQWREIKSQSTKKKNGGGTETVTTYRYEKGWSSSLINSYGFQEPANHENPSSMPYSPTVINANPINIGVFQLSDALTAKINWFSDLTNGISTGNIPDDSMRSQAKTFGNGFFFGDNPSYPEVGDSKVMFKVIPEGFVSVVGGQTGNSFAPYVTKRGGTILLLRQGVHTAEEMFLLAEQDNAILTWLLRFVGFFVMFIGLKLVVAPMEVMVDVLPFIGPCVGDLVGAGSSVVVALVAGILSALVIAISWLLYRPFFAVLFLGVIGILGYFLKKKVDERRQRRDFSATPTHEMPKLNDLSFEQV